MTVLPEGLDCGLVGTILDFAFADFDESRSPVREPTEACDFVADESPWVLVIEGADWW